MVPHNKLNSVFMEKFSFFELVVLAKSLNVDFDRLLRSDVNGSLVAYYGAVYDRDNPVDSSVICASDENYDKLSALLNVLKGILEYRPLPF